jgi:preprotein translocase subunit SecF
MEFFKPGATIDFMKYSRICGIVSGILVLASVVSMFVPGPNYGIDFKGGTELEVAFTGRVTPEELRSAMGALGYGSSEVIGVEGTPNQYIIRVQEVSSLPAAQVTTIEARLKKDLAEFGVDEMKVSPGGDKISLRLGATAPVELIESALTGAGAKVRSVSPFGRPDDHRYEAQLLGVGDEMVQALKSRLGARAPDAPLRVEWVGPKAGAQLRDAAIKSLIYSLAFIMVYVAFRFDLRFAPGGIIALMHDVLITVGVYVLLRKEVSLATVAALLTIVGFSINDTIVIYDRIRENMQRMRDTSLRQLINVSTTQTLSRTIITSTTTMISISGFFIWGTPVIKDIVFALFVGFTAGVYSSIYIAAPVTEWFDRRFFRRAA